MVSRKILFLFFAASFFATASQVRANTSDFDFGSCESRLSQTGDRAHYSTGTHQIVGGGLVLGSDNVFSLGDNNFLQCFCPTEGNTGIQTNWLRTNEPIGGWFFQNGNQWNLGNFNYAAKNSDFNCHPTPTPTINPTGAPQPCNGCGVKSFWVCDSAQPLPPTNFSVVRTGKTARLSWTESTGTTHYSLVYGTKPGVYEYGVVNTGKTNTFTVGSLDPGKKYYFAIRSVNNCMPSELNSVGEILGASSVKGLASTGSVSQIVSLFAAGFISLILFAGLNKLISLCENNENIQIVVNATKKFAVGAADNIYCLLRDGVMVYVGQVLQSGPAQLFRFSDTAPPNRDKSIIRYSSGAFAYSIAIY